MILIGNLPGSLRRELKTTNLTSSVSGRVWFGTDPVLLESFHAQICMIYGEQSRMKSYLSRFKLRFYRVRILYGSLHGTAYIPDPAHCHVTVGGGIRGKRRLGE